jgi:voltage-gated potassium channel
MAKKKKEVRSRPKKTKKTGITKAPSAPPPAVQDTEKGKKDISLLKLINYNLIVFIPVLIFTLVALKIGSVYSDYFEASPGIITKIFMVPFMVIVFFFLIPYIRDREKIEGIRYSLLAFLIIGIGLTLPSALKGNTGLILTLPNYFASYLLLTFFFCPEVLGIERTIRDWFKHRKHMSIVAIYVSIVLLYVIGFGTLYYDIYNDPVNPNAFSFSVDKEPGLASFIYYSMVSFTTTGYGEMLPVSTAARLVFFMEGLVGLIVNVLFIAILLVFISNAEFLSQKAEETKLVKKVEEEAEELKKEAKEIRKVEKEVAEVKERESALTRFFRRMRPW